MKLDYEGRFSSESSSRGAHHCNPFSILSILERGGGAKWSWIMRGDFFWRLLVAADWVDCETVKAHWPPFPPDHPRIFTPNQRPKKIPLSPLITRIQQTQRIPYKHLSPPFHPDHPRTHRIPYKHPYSTYTLKHHPNTSKLKEYL